MVGFTDKPVAGKMDDIFGVGKYIQGLSGFIMDCDTPMTVAVQGDWGSGKTSFMMLIREEIEDKVLPVWFNTWQFSQFNLGDQLPIMLVSKLTSALEVKGTTGDTMKKSLKTLSGALLHVGLSVADNLSNADISGAVESVSGQGNTDVTEVVAELKEQFQNFVDISLKKHNKNRVVIFVDDLDRLQPAKAVELLEVLKLFLDCDKCVFILAIDYAVVSQGIKQKYGDSLGNDKGRSFFDKIIQVPFKMPVAHYDVAKYVKAALSQMKVTVNDEAPYIELIRTSIGYTPRSMKRLMNAFLLLQRIHSDENLSEEHAQRILFAVLCLQLSYEEIYNFIVRNIDRTGTDFYNQLADSSNYPASFNDSVSDEPNERENLDTVLLELFEEGNLSELDDPSRVAAFMKSFREALVNQNGCLTNADLLQLNSILKFSAATASVVHEGLISSNGNTGTGVRYENKLDDTFKYHKINEPIRFDQKKKLPGWNNSVMEKFCLDGVETPAKKYGDMQCKVLGWLYRQNPEKFNEIRNNATQYGLSGLFNGIGGAIQAPVLIEGTDMKIETKTDSHRKVTDLCKVFKAMNYDPGILELYVKLAHRVVRDDSTRID